MYNILLLFFLYLLSSFSYASDIIKDGSDSSSQVNNGKFESYFVSTKSDEVNVRTGPSKKYPLKWRIIRANEPLKVTKKFEHWREIIDSTGDSGWVHVSNISSKRYVKTLNHKMINIYQEPNENSKISFKAESDIILYLNQCTNSWCKVEKNGYKGWVLSKYIWGI